MAERVFVPKDAELVPFFAAENVEISIAIDVGGDDTIILDARLSGDFVALPDWVKGSVFIRKPSGS